MSTQRQRRGLAGVSSLRRKLRRMPDVAKDIVKEAIADSAEELKFEMLQRVPVDRGVLASSIEVKLGSDKLSATVGVGARTKKAKKLAFIARFVEFGTVNMPARPFIFPALEAGQNDISATINKAVDKALKRVSEG